MTKNYSVTSNTSSLEKSNNYSQDHFDSHHHNNQHISSSYGINRNDGKLGMSYFDSIYFIVVTMSTVY
jgi:hypothetical protein